jgi:hypothetical protein
MTSKKNRVQPVFFFLFLFFLIFSWCFESGDQPQEDLAKSGYKTNKEIRKSRNPVLHVGEPQEPIS